jgi:hypothetical protein
VNTQTNMITSTRMIGYASIIVSSPPNSIRLA